MATNLTNMAIGAILFGLIMGAGLALLGNFSNIYQVPLDNNFSEFDSYTSQNSQYTGQYSNVSQGASIDAQSLGSAQLQGLISAEKTKVGFFTLLSTSIQQAFKYFPVTASVITVFTMIMSILGIAALYQAVRGVRP